MDSNLLELYEKRYNTVEEEIRDERLRLED